MTDRFCGYDKCPNCQYDLTNLPGSICPECGQDIHASIKKHKEKEMALDYYFSIVMRLCYGWIVLYFVDSCYRGYINRAVDFVSTPFIKVVFLALPIQGLLVIVGHALFLRDEKIAKMIGRLSLVAASLLIIGHLIISCWVMLKV